VSSDGAHWFLLNVSPDIRLQIEGFSALHPRSTRDTPLSGLVLTSGDLDHCLGLLCLRESQPITIYATAPVRDGFCEYNAFSRTLARFPGHSRWIELELSGRTALTLPGGEASGLEVEAIALAGRPPLHLRDKVSGGSGDNVGLVIHDLRREVRFGYFSGCSEITQELQALFASLDCLFFDGTFWSDDELARMNAGTGTAHSMGHVPLSGEGGSLALIRSPQQRYFIHINNTNPILVEDSRERAEVERQGWRVTHDGLELFLPADTSSSESS
jgi:pyrroloquinoline quinone biosynthesis protein B